MAVDWNKPLQTRDGRQARLIGSYEGSEWTKVVAVRAENGSEVLTAKYESGLAGLYNEGPGDIINVPEEKVVYRNFYARAHLTHKNFDSLEEAKDTASPESLGTIRYTIVDGVLKAAEVV